MAPCTSDTLSVIVQESPHTNSRTPSCHTVSKQYLGSPNQDCMKYRGLRIIAMITHVMDVVLPYIYFNPSRALASIFSLNQLSSSQPRFRRRNPPQSLTRVPVHGACASRLNTKHAGDFAIHSHYLRLGTIRAKDHIASSERFI